MSKVWCQNVRESINTIRLYKGGLYRLRKGYVEDGL